VDEFEGHGTLSGLLEDGRLRQDGPGQAVRARVFQFDDSGSRVHNVGVVGWISRRRDPPLGANFKLCYSLVMSNYRRALASGRWRQVGRRVWRACV